MNINKKKFTRQVEIDNLLEEAVSNALTRHKQAHDLEELSDEQLDTINGGVINSRVTTGYREVKENNGPTKF